MSFTFCPLFCVLVHFYVCLSTYVVCPLMKVMASKTKIYIVMELVTGGELFDKIVSVWSSHPCLIEALSSEHVMNLRPSFGLGFAWKAERG